MTTNPPDSLDEAPYRPGRIDIKFYLGHSTKTLGAITFKRVFGKDPSNKIPQKCIERMAKQFGRLILKNTFTPCEIQEFCIERRGRSKDAIGEFL